MPPQEAFHYFKTRGRAEEAHLQVDRVNPLAGRRAGLQSAERTEADDLEIFVETRDLSELLERLRGLRQRV